MTEVEENAADKVAEKVEDLSLAEEKSEDADTTDVSATVFRSIEDFNIVHPLTHSWTLWYTKPPQTGSEEWHDLLKEVVTVSTVEEFWGAYNSIPKVSELPLKADYSFFKAGISPEWEDKHNSKGGKWLCQFRQGRKHISVDDAWLRVLLGMIGGTLDNDAAGTEEINGAFINVRKVGTKINLWTKNTNPDLLRPVGTRFKGVLGLGERDEIEFTAHEGKGRSKITL
jgi:translation initiation factor 4E